jgi:NADH-quinone oxidoreductase subunit E
MNENRNNEANQADSPCDASSSHIPHPSSFILDTALRAEIENLLSRYPTKQAVTLPALHLINQHLGYVPTQAVVELAELLELAPAQVQDTLSFYGFFKQDKPKGKYQVYVCHSITCAACDGEELLKYLCEKLGVQPGETTADGRVNVDVTECLGACDAAPAMLVNDELHENVTKEKIDALVNAITQSPIPNP